MSTALHMVSNPLLGLQLEAPLVVLGRSHSRLYIYKVLHQSNNRGKYSDGFYNFMVVDNGRQMPSPLIIYTCTAFRHFLLEWKRNSGTSPKARSKLDAPTKPNPANYFNY